MVAGVHLESFAEARGRIQFAECSFYSAGGRTADFPRDSADRRVAGLASAAYALAALQYGGGEDDDEAFERIPGFVKDRALIARLPGDRYVTIPVPYGYGFAVALGNALYSASRGGDIDKLSMRLASSALENFSPIGNPLAGADSWGDVDSKSVLELLPGIPFGELTRDAVRLIGNRSGLGHEIVPDSRFDEGKPDHMRLYRGTKGSVYDLAARGLSNATGGTASQAGAIDLSPETLKFWTHAVTGGAGTFAADTAKLGRLGIGALLGEEGDLTPELREIPVARRFLREDDIHDSRSRYWDAADEACRVAQAYRRARKADDEAGMVRIEESSQAQLEAARSFIRWNRQIGRLRDEIDEIAQDGDLSLGIKRVMIKELETAERELYDEAVREFRAEVRAQRKRRAEAAAEGQR